MIKAYQAFPRTPAGRKFEKETLEQRLLRKSSVVPSGCRVWAGALYNGYGFSSRPREGKPVKVHRLAYEAWIGSIPEGLTIDHLCRNRACIEPTHLEAVTIGVNTLRGDSVSGRNSRKTHCNHGHPFSGDNLAMLANGDRVCRTCRRDSSTRWKERQRGIA